MSNNFINSDIDDLLSSIQTENNPLPQWLNIVNIDKEDATTKDATTKDASSNEPVVNMEPSKDVASETSENIFMNNNQVFSATSINNLNATSDFPVQNGGFNSVTSSDINDIFIGQLGGNNNKLSVSPDDINNLIDMLTTEKVNDNFDTVTSITNTDVLENQLRELLTKAKDEQKGGAKKSSKSKSSKKSKKSSKKSKKSSKKSKKSSKKKYSKKHKNEETAVESTSESPAQVPAPKPEKKKRAPNPALIAFGKLSKHVSEKLGISNGPKAKKVAGAANREIKAKHPELSAVEVAAKAADHFDANMERFRKILEE